MAGGRKSEKRNRGREKRAAATGRGRSGPAPERSEPSPEPPWLRGALAVGLVVAVLAVFGQVRGHGFVNLDDHVYVADNPLLVGGPTPENLVRAFVEPYETNWIPLTWISLQVDYALYGLEPAGYLLTNVALHALSTLLLFAALLRMTGATGRSAFVAAVFALHPLHVESVAWVSERKDTLSTVFWNLTLLAYARYVAEPRSLVRYAGVFLSLAVGLLAKPMLVTLPFVLLLLDYWPLSRLRAEGGGPWPDPGRLRRAVLEKLPLFALVAAASAITFGAQRSGGAMQMGELMPFDMRLMNALESYVIYLWDAVWPSGLAVFYPHPLYDLSAGRAAVCALALLALSAAAVRLAGSRPYLLVGWLWYLGTLVPVIGLVQVGFQARADRYMYLPLVGLSLALAWGAVEAFSGSRARHRALAVAGALCAAALGVAAWIQTGHWRDSDSLFRHAIAVTGPNHLAHHLLGDVLVARGELAEAERHYREYARLRPNSWDPQFRLGEVLEKQGRLPEAIAALERGLAMRESARPLANLGLAYAKLGRPEEGWPHVTRAVALDPESATNQAALGLVASQLGRTDTALRAYRASLRGDPTDANVANNLAWLLATSPDAELRDAAEARRLAEGALRAAGDANPALLDTLAAAHAAAGSYVEAASTARRAVELASAAGAHALAADIRTRLVLYEKGEPYVERPPAAD